MNVKEIKIPVPWGHIAGKAWGNEKDDAILALHGIADNAGTFDRILPLLLPNYYYICLDLPSHGLSSPYPPHLFVSALDNVFALKLIVEYINRPNLIIMGHSWGGQTAMVYCQLYPQRISKLIILDAIYLYPLEVQQFKQIMVANYEGLTKISKNNTGRLSYTKEEAINKLMSGRRYGSILRESAEALFKRSVVPVEDNKFQFTADARLKYFVNGIFDMKFVADLMDKCPVTCPILFIVSSLTKRFQYIYFKEVLEKLKLHNKHVTTVDVHGGHDVHSDKPEVVAPLINKFLLDLKNKL